jgi:alkaline phosphatase
VRGSFYRRCQRIGQLEMGVLFGVLYHCFGMDTFVCGLSDWEFLNYIQMKRILFIQVFLSLFAMSVFAQSIKNVVFMVPDGTSISNLALARWYQIYKNSDQTTRLAIDSLICGVVKTHSSNAPIGDSAPTMSAYMTGYLSQANFISMYPPKDADNDLSHIDSERSYDPCVTVMEAARIVKNKAIGLVFTCEFPHATPAGTSAHWYDRRDYTTLQEQMVHNAIDVLIGGGAGLLTQEQETFLTNADYEVFREGRDDLDKFKNTNAMKLWALFGNKSMANDWDRDSTKQPSLAEMTNKALTLLSKNEQGFFLMVEGSKIDWACHQNDPSGILSEMLAFDAAVKEVIKFAKNNGETLVVICPDHGNGGVSIGNSRSNGNYNDLSLKELMDPLAKCTKTSEYIAEYLTNMPKDSIQPIIQRYWGFSNISADTIEMINKDINKMIVKVLQSRTYIGFTTQGHTGEDVFLAIYHPQNNRLTGLVTAVEINRYLCDVIGIDYLDGLTNEYYCPVTDVFKEKDFLIEPSSGGILKITPRNDEKTTLVIKANSNQVLRNEQIFQTKTPAIYVDKNNTWYISRECLGL